MESDDREPRTAKNQAGRHPPASTDDAVSIDLQHNPWGWWRSQMPVSRQFAYLDHAAVAPLSQRAADAIQMFTQQSATGGDTHWPQWASQVEKLRDLTAQWLRCTSDEVVVVPNTTTGINLVAEGWPWKPGDNVVVPEGEFPSNLFPWLNQQSRGVEVRVIPRVDGQVRIDDLMAAVDSSTRIIAVSWVGYASGYRLDVDQLVQAAHQRGVLVFLDAIQGLGMYPLDLSRIPVDFLAADGHKWLLGPEGCGVAMIRREHLGKLRCGNVGWGSVKNSHNYAAPRFELRDDARRFESGSANMIGAAALLASFGLFAEIRQTHGESAIAQRVISLVQTLDEGLRQLGATTRMPSSAQHRSGILTFEVPGGEPAEIRRRALQENVVLSVRDGGVRASVHAYNDADDLNRLLDVVRASR